MMCTKRDKRGKTSYHGLVQVTDADGKWCKDFAKKHTSTDLEIFAPGRNLAMLGEYEIKGGGRRGMSSWEWCDGRAKRDAVRLATKLALETMIGDVREKLEEAADVDSVAGNAADVPAVDVRGRKVVPAGEGKRHAALMSECFRVIGGLTKATRTREAVFAEVMKSDRIEGMSDYETGSKHVELEDLIDMALVKFEDDKYAVVINHCKEKYKFATLVGEGWFNQYNVWYYDEKSHLWSDEVGKLILNEFESVVCRGLSKSSHTASEIARHLGRPSSGALEVRIDKAYADRRMKMIIDGHGNYLDLVACKIRKINPETDYFEDHDVTFELVKNGMIRSSSWSFCSSGAGTIGGSFSTT